MAEIYHKEIQGNTALGDFRQAVVLQVREQFERYGPEVTSTLISAAVRTGGLQRLLHALALPPTSHFALQIERLSLYAAAVGTEEFLRHVRAGLEIDAPPSLPRIIAEETAPSRALDATQPRRGNDDPLVLAIRELEVHEQQVRVSRARTEMYRVRPQTDNAAPHGIFTGTERRGTERRSGADRRDDLRSVSENRRSGADRRKLSGRRVTD